MSTYKSCWRWSVSQFSTCMSLLRHGCQRHSFWNSQTDHDSQMYTLTIDIDNLTNWQFVQTVASKLQSKPRVVDTNDVKQKNSLFSVQGKICLVFFHGFCSFVLRHLCRVNEVNDQTPITAGHPLHPFITWIYVQNG